MRGQRKCGSCCWFEDRSEEFHAGYIQADGLCHWRMPATVAKDSQGWGDWHQKGSAPVKKQDWCSCWGASPEVTIDEQEAVALPAPSGSAGAYRR